MNQELINHYYLLLIQSINFDNKAVSEILKKVDNKLPVPIFIDCLYEYVSYMCENNYIEDKYKTNLYELISLIRQNAHSTDINDKMNDLIAMLNLSDGSRSDEFYTAQLSKRCPKINSKTFFKDYDVLKRILIESLASDFSLLEGCLSKVTEEEFEQFIENYEISTSFFLSLRALISDQKYLRQDYTFVSRLFRIVEKPEGFSYANDLSKGSLIKLKRSIDNTYNCFKKI